MTATPDEGREIADIRPGWMTIDPPLYLHAGERLRCTVWDDGTITDVQIVPWDTKPTDPVIGWIAPGHDVPQHEPPDSTDEQPSTSLSRSRTRGC